MSTPFEPRSAGEPDVPAQPITREIPVVAPATAAPPLPPHPGATPPAPVPATGSGSVLPAETVNAPQPTGPVDFVPGLPGAGTPPPPPPGPPTAPTAPPAPAAAAGTGAPIWPDTLEPDAAADERPAKRRPARDRATPAGVGLAVLALVLLELGLVLDFGTRSLWSAVPLWSAFATAAALLALLAFAASAPARDAARPGVVWRVAAGGLVGLAVFWLLVVLPDADTNRGFVLTAALACLGAGVWIGPGRKS
ncbi:MAG: hypothetical protein JWP40_1537 [Blastococcus sp.]|nr:hypothetical protein [Blastococcus sp.]